MSTRKFAAVSAGFVAALVGLRIVDMAVFTEIETGFYRGGFRGLTLPLLLTAACFVIFAARFVRLRSAEYFAWRVTPPPVAAGAALALVGFLCFFAAGAARGSVTPGSALFFLLAAAYFALTVGFALVGKPLPVAVNFLPVAYWVYKLIRFFTNISDIAVISENLYRLASVIFTLVAYTLLAKVVCGVGTARNGRIFTVEALLAALSVAVSEVAPFILAAARGSVTLNGRTPDPELVFSAVYLCVCVFALNSSRVWSRNASTGPLGAEDAESAEVPPTNVDAEIPSVIGDGEAPLTGMDAEVPPAIGGGETTPAGSSAEIPLAGTGAEGPESSDVYLIGADGEALFTGPEGSEVPSAGADGEAPPEEPSIESPDWDNMEAPTDFPPTAGAE